MASRVWVPSRSSIRLIVENSTDENRYGPQLEAVGYVLRFGSLLFAKIARSGRDLGMHLHAVSDGCF